MKKDYQFFLTSASENAGVPGFWAVDLASELRAQSEEDYADYWVSKRTPERLNTISPPDVSLDVGMNSHGGRCVTASRAGVTLTDPDSDSMIAKLVQRKFFVYASNHLSPSDLPVFLSASPSGPPSCIQLIVRPIARTCWDSPDVRLGVARLRRSFEESNQRFLKKIARKYGDAASANFKPSDPTLEYERFARATPLRSGLFLPVSFEMIGSTFDAVLRLESDMGADEAQATLFSDRSLGEVKSGTKIYRHVFLNYAGHAEEATDLVAITV